MIDQPYENGILYEYTGAGGEVTLPADLREIGYRAFADLNNVTAVTLPEGAKQIGESAFSGCTALTRIHIPASVKKIEISAFEDCTALSLVTFAGIGTEVEEYAFARCDKLRIRAHAPQCVNFPTEDYTAYAALGFLAAGDSFPYTEADADYYREWIEAHLSAILPQLVTEPTALRTLLAGDLLLPHYDQAIALAATHEHAEINAMLLAWGADHATALDAMRATRLDALLCADPTDPDLLSALWDWEEEADGSILLTAYKGDETTVLVPATIGDRPVTAIGQEAFAPVRDGLLPHRADYYRGGLLAIVLPDTLTTIGYGAFFQCKSLRSIRFGSAITDIGPYAFADCQSLADVVFPPSVRTISASALAQCTSLSTVSLPEGVTQIESWAFEGCTALTDVTIPDSVQSLGDHAFFGCHALTIHGKPGSIAEAHAEKNKIKFCAM